MDTSHDRKAIAGAEIFSSDLNLLRFYVFFVERSELAALGKKNVK